MKITKVETLAAQLTGRDSLIVRVHTDAGLVGLGEAYPVGPNEAVAATISDFESWIAGRDPRDINGLWYHLYAHSRFPGGSVVNAAISGIEHALWDIAGKAAGVPVYRLLGGKCRDRIRVYQSCSGSTPEAIAAHARQLVDAYGYTALKMSPHPPNSDQLPWSAVVRQAGERLAAVREAVGPDVDIGLDPHARIFEPMRALEMAEAVRPYRPFFFEEPLRPENIDALAWLAQKSDVPIATGEMLYTSFGFRELLAKQAATIIQPDICVCGGLLEMKKIAALAEAHYVTVAPHNPLGPLATAINVHFAATTHNFLILEYHSDDESPRRDVLLEPLQLRDGYLEIPEEPGWGVELNEASMGSELRSWHRPFSTRPDGATAFI
ncbi:MAG: galactonate dehydratase [Dehalococcoidia bacterium]|nr:galactonate dehydratase [Dehalococcoidia bacterium]